MAYFHANMMPPPVEPDPVMVDRKEAMAAAALLDSPEEALARRKNGGGVPAHYLPTPALTTDGQGGRDLDKGVVPWDTHKKSSSAE